MIYLPSPLEDGAFLAELKGERGVPSASPTYPVDILPRLDHPVSNQRMITSVPRRSLPAGLAIAFACHELMRPCRILADSRASRHRARHLPHHSIRIPVIFMA